MGLSLLSYYLIYKYLATPLPSITRKKTCKRVEMGLKEGNRLGRDKTWSNPTKLKGK